MRTLIQNRRATKVAICAAAIAVTAVLVTATRSSSQGVTPAGASSPLGAPTPTRAEAGSPSVDKSSPSPTSDASAPVSVSGPSGPPVTPPGPTVSFPSGPTTLPVQVSTSPTSGVVDGATVTLRVNADPGSKLYGVEARLCARDAEVQFDADFHPTQTGLCILRALSVNSDAHKDVAVGPPNESVDVSFRVGVGVDTYTTQDGRPVNIRCGAGNPCQLVVKLQVPGGFGFRSFPITYA